MAANKSTHIIVKDDAIGTYPKHRIHTHTHTHCLTHESSTYEMFGFVHLGILRLGDRKSLMHVPENVICIFHMKYQIEEKKNISHWRNEKHDCSSSLFSRSSSRHLLSQYVCSLTTPPHVSLSLSSHFVLYNNIINEQQLSNAILQFQIQFHMQFHFLVAVQDSKKLSLRCNYDCACAQCTVILTENTLYPIQCFVPHSYSTPPHCNCFIVIDSME